MDGGEEQSSIRLTVTRFYELKTQLKSLTDASQVINGNGGPITIQSDECFCFLLWSLIASLTLLGKPSQ
jgi:hypothetical protein